MKVVPVMVMMLVIGMTSAPASAVAPEEICDNMEEHFIWLVMEVQPGNPLDEAVREAAKDCGTNMIPYGADDTLWSAVHLVEDTVDDYVVLEVPGAPTQCELACESERFVVEQLPSPNSNWYGLLLTCEISAVTPFIEPGNGLPPVPQTTVKQQYYYLREGQTQTCPPLPGYGQPETIHYQYVYQEMPRVVPVEFVSVIIETGLCNMTFGVHVGAQEPRPGFSSPFTVPCTTTPVVTLENDPRDW